MDIVRVSKGYHIDFTDKAPYGGFDEKWLNKKHHRPEEKEYTQFIRTIYDKEDDYCYLWNKSNNFTLDRDLFPVVNKELAEFVNALRTSLNSRGDALEISRNAFYSINQMLARF